MSNYEKILLELMYLTHKGIDQALAKKDTELFDKYKFVVELMEKAESDFDKKEMDCSCTLCVCENETQCQGCGAKKCDPCKKARGG